MVGIIQLVDVYGKVVKEFLEDKNCTMSFGHLPPGASHRDEMNLFTQIANDVRSAIGQADKNVPLPFPERIEPFDQVVDLALYDVVYRGQRIKRTTSRCTKTGTAKKQGRQ